MQDVVVIGGGHAGLAIAQSLSREDLQVTILDECCTKADHWDGEWIQGRGAVVSTGLVVALDPDTSDERRMIPCRAVVIAIGAMEPVGYTRHLLGITKLGAEFSPDNTQIITDESGRTRAEGVFAAGSCASSATPNIISAVVSHCSQTAQTTETAPV